MQLHFKSYGQGRPLIVLHGLLGSLDNWHSISLQLAGHFQVFAVDQRNHGCSPHSPEMDYYLMAEDLNEFMRAQHLPHARVLGHSMGAKTAMQLALLHPDRVEKLIAVDLAPRAYPLRHERIFAGLLSIDPAAFQTRKQMEEALAPSIPDLALRQFLLKNVTRDPGGRFRWKIGLREIHRNYARLAEALAHERPFTKPTLFIRGENSDYLREEDLSSIHRLFPHAQLQAIPKAGHLVHAENPGAFLEAVLKFLR
jgi:pimeloyl-ACP methyl ester carboxylesterase